MRYRLLCSVLSVALLVSLSAAPVLGHCQIPCGIYGDEQRFTAMLEDLTTIEKSMQQIGEIGSQSKPDWNQLVRWVQNKEVHADRLIETVTAYFLTQRIKPPAEGDAKAQMKYTKHLTLLHQMMVHAMKAKQTTDLSHVGHLRELIGTFKASYLDHDH